MKTGLQSRLHRFTVGIPASLFERGEEERARLELNRSEYVAYLYRRHLEELQRERRIERHGAAYRRHPPTAAEDALTAASTEILASEPS